MYICKKCELVFEYPYPSQDELKTFYNDNYHNQRDYKSLGKIGKLRKKMNFYFEIGVMAPFCQAQLLLFSAQISKLNYQGLNSETKGAELTLKSHCTTHHPPPTTETFLS